MQPWIWILICVAALALGFLAGVIYRKAVAAKQLNSAEEEARRILSEAIHTAETKKKEALIEAKEEILAAKNEADAELKERRKEVARQERRIAQKEESLDSKTEALEKKDSLLNEKHRAADE